MQTVLIINSKGGSGKTTLATNLAGLYASRRMQTVLMDYDPQGSSLQWLKLRATEHPAIYPVNASRSKAGVTRTWQLHVPPGTERLVIDAPAGVSGVALQDMVRRADIILIPVTPSPLDVHATTEFFRDLLLVGKVRSYSTRVGVVANRVRRGAPLYEPLRRFLESLHIPLVTVLESSEQYIRAAEHGLGIHELDPAEVSAELEQWLPLLKWLEGEEVSSDRRSANRLHAVNDRKAN